MQQISIMTLALSLFFGVSQLSADDWRQFRGDNASGHAMDANVPTEWSENSQPTWTTGLPGRGLSCPIVVGNRVIVTASSGPEDDRLHVLCFNTNTGEQIWKRQFWATGNTRSHRKMSNATPTPVSDGKQIYAFFSSNDLICLDLNGNLTWFRGITHDYPNASNSLGMSSSPVVADDTVVVQVEADSESFAMGLNTANGVTRWKKDRPRKANWTSPVHWTANDSDAVLLQSSKGVSAVEPKTGKVIWEFKESASTIPSSTADESTIYIPSKGITAVRPNGNGVEVLWNANKLSPSTASPVIANGRIYCINRAGALTCGNVKDGSILWQFRVKGPFSATPVYANGYLFAVNEEGLLQVVDAAGEKAKLAGEYNLGETVLSTPAISDGALYIRSDGKLWKFGQ